jgi:hypothetical protein
MNSMTELASDELICCSVGRTTKRSTRWPALAPDQVLRSEPLQRFSDGGTRNTELARELLLGRQTLVDLEPAVHDRFANVGGDLLGDASGDDWFQAYGHLFFPSRRRWCFRM